MYRIPEKEPMLELQVLMLNINDGNNEALKGSCQILKEYMQYVNRVRKNIYEKKLTLDTAVEVAVRECIKEGILEEFLRENQAEVVAMSIFEFDEEKEWKLIREDEYQYGLEEGLKQGLKALISSLKMLSADLETVYNAVIQHEMYKDLTLEQVRELYYAK